MSKNSMNNIEVKMFKKKSTLNEIYQSTQMQFSFMSKKGEQCHPWVLCRDFLHDAVRTEITGIASHIYGFSYVKGENPPIDLTKMRMLVRKNVAVNDFDERMECALNVLNHYEKRAGITLSKMYNIKNEGCERVRLFIGSSIWMRSSPLVSMYTMLIRLGDKKYSFKNHEELLARFTETTKLRDAGKGESNDNDASYLKTTGDKFDLILKNRRILFQKDFFSKFKDISINSFHNSGGIWSLCSSCGFDKEAVEKIKVLTQNK